MKMPEDEVLKKYGVMKRCDEVFTSSEEAHQLYGKCG